MDQVADREADIYEYLVSCQERGHGFVIRAANDRALSHPETGKRTGRLFTAARSAVPLGEFTRVAPKAATPCAHGALSGECHLRGVECPMAPGTRAGQASPDQVHRRARLGSHCPRCWERLEWILLCDANVHIFAQAHAQASAAVCHTPDDRGVSQCHQDRGSARNDCNWKSAERLFAAIAIMSVVALRLLELGARAPAQASRRSGGTGPACILSNWKCCG